MYSNQAKVNSLSTKIRNAYAMAHSTPRVLWITGRAVNYAWRKVFQFIDYLKRSIDDAEAIHRRLVAAQEHDYAKNAAYMVRIR